MVRHVVANSILYDKKLTLNVINTYKAFIELNEKGTTGTDNANWCNTLASLLTTKANELERDELFSELAEALQLNGSLLAV